MKRSRFTDTQIVKILKKAEAGVAVEELSRKHGFSKSTFYKWKARYGGMDATALSICPRTAMIFPLSSGTKNRPFS